MSARDGHVERRRALERLEGRLVGLHLARPDPDADRVVDALRYVLSFAKLTTVRNADGQDVEVHPALADHARYVRDTLGRALRDAETVWVVSGALPELLRRTREARRAVLERFPLDRPSLEAEVTRKLLVVAAGGGGGAGYVYPGVFEMLDRSGVVPDLVVGTSAGALMGAFRCRSRRYDFAPLVAAARRLTWGSVFQVLETENKYGLPATLRLHLRSAVGEVFRHPEGRPLWLSDMEIPLYCVATGITVDALKHDLGYYEHLLDEDVSGLRSRVRGGFKALSVLREFLGRRDALVEVVLGRDAGTEHFDTVDAAGFSSAVPGVIHYDVLRDDARMRRILDQLYAERGITRLGEGGMVANVPARIAWESAHSGRLGRRNAFVLALDCFAPNARRIAWFAMQQAVRAANVDGDRPWADLYVAFRRTLSPANLLPGVRDSLTAIRWGREEIQPHMPFILAMMRPVPVLPDEPT